MNLNYSISFHIQFSHQFCFNFIVPLFKSIKFNNLLIICLLIIINKL